MTDTSGDSNTTNKSAGFITLQTVNGKSIIIENDDLIPDTFDKFKSYIMTKCNITLTDESPDTLLIISNGVILDSTTYKKPNLIENEHYILLLVSKSSFETVSSRQKHTFDAYGDNTSDSDTEEIENENAYTLRDLEIIEEKLKFTDTEAGKFLSRLSKKLIESGKYPPLPEVPMEGLLMLTSMGLSEIQAKNALLKSGMSIEEASNYAFDHMGEPSEEVLITPQEYARLQSLRFGGGGGGGARIMEGNVLVGYLVQNMEAKGMPLECVPFAPKYPMGDDGLILLDNIFLVMKSKGIGDVLSIGCVQNAIRGFLEDPVGFVPSDDQIEILAPFIERASKAIRLN